MPNAASPPHEWIRAQTLRALAANRVPGYHFPGHFLGCHWPRIGEADLDVAMPDAPQGRNVDGTVHLAGACVLLDIALATAARLRIEPGARQATVHLHAQFTGAPLRGELRAHARADGDTSGSAARERLSSATVYAGDAPACHATGTFIQLPPPPGITLAPLPWQQGGGAAATAPLKAGELDAEERAVMRACRAALRRADSRHAFIEHFWSVVPAPAPDGARCAVKLGPQHGNRVRHVQGGLLFGLAAATAQAAAPRHPRLSALAAWYISPGQGARLRIASRRLHEGRSFAAVRTEVRNADGSRVLEVVSHHAA